MGGGCCRLMALPGEGLVGITTSKKIGNTPQRNRAKRRFREGWRKQEARVRGNLDYVLIVTPQGAGAPFGALVEELGSLLDAMSARWEGDSECG